MSINRVLVFTTFLLLHQNVLAQRTDADTAHIAMATSRLRQQYYETRKSESLLFTGSDYAEYEAIADEHPFFLSDDWISGDICYNSSTYQKVPLQLDVYSQKLVTEHPGTGKKLELIAEHVSWFTLENHHFISLPRNPPNSTSQGYYELLADGPVKLLARHTKAFQESTVTGKLQVRVDEATKYFVYKKQSLLPVKNKSSLISALADKKAQLTTETKRRGLNFNRDKQQAMIETIKIYNSLP